MPSLITRIQKCIEELEDIKKILEKRFVLPEPEMTGGEEPRVVFERLAANQRVPWDTEKNLPICKECGETMVRNGACYKCPNCGATEGCS